MEVVLTGMGPVFTFELTRVRWYVCSIAFRLGVKKPPGLAAGRQITARVMAGSGHQIGNRARSAKFRAWTRRRLECQAMSEEPGL